MDADNQKSVNDEHAQLVAQISTAETALKGALQTRGFGTTPRAHMERALEHIREAYIAVNENKPVRSVHQLAGDLARVEEVIDNAKRGKSQRI